MSDTSAATTQLHATCVALDAQCGLLILGASGAGKSALALSLMAFGAHLVSDDRTDLHRDPAHMAVTARAPASISGLIEARGLGLLAAPPLRAATIKGVVDLDQMETDRLPPLRKTYLIGVELPLFHRVDAPHFAPALFQWLKGGRSA